MPRYLENREKSLNLKVDQKVRKKSEDFIKLTDWQSPIEWTSHQYWKQNVCNSGLKLHTCDFPAKSQKCMIILQFSEVAYHSSDYGGIPWSLKFLIEKFHKTLDCRFLIFGFLDLIFISSNKSMHSIINLSYKFWLIFTK